MIASAGTPNSANGTQRHGHSRRESDVGTGKRSRPTRASGMANPALPTAHMRQKTSRGGGHRWRSGASRGIDTPMQMPMEDQCERPRVGVLPAESPEQESDREHREGDQELRPAVPPGEEPVAHR